MKYFEVFKAGEYPQGKFTAEQIAELANNYDPGFCEAPITLDHEQSGPAYGWVKTLKAEGGVLKASFKDVAEDLKSFVNEGKYRKISVEIYRSLEGKSPYLKAVSFLGASIPQVKGLQSVEFKDAESDIYTFEAQVEEDNTETQELKEQIKKLEEKVKSFTSQPKDSETVKEHKQQVKTLSAQVDSFKEQAQGKVDLEKEITELKNSMRDKEFSEFVEKKIEEGILTPANKDAVLKVLKDLDNIKKFDESSNTIQDFKTFINSLPKQVEFGEIATKDKKLDKNSKGEFDEFANVSEESKDLFEQATALAEKEKIPFKDALLKIGGNE
jgi:septal ring factor EnvC (AmiA/AmiB activator)